MAPAKGCGTGVWPVGGSVAFALNFWFFSFKRKELAPAAMSGTIIVLSKDRSVKIIFYLDTPSSCCNSESKP